MGVWVETDTVTLPLWVVGDVYIVQNTSNDVKYCYFNNNIHFLKKEINLQLEREPMT